MIRPTHQLMNGPAVLEIVDAVRAIVEKHHGPKPSNEAMLLTDYTAVALLAFADMGLRDKARAERNLDYDQLAGNLKRMCHRVAENGIAGLMGSQVAK